MTIEKKIEGTVLKIALEGELNTMTAPDLENAVIPELEKVNDVEIDMTRLTYITSAGLRILLSAKQRIKDRGNIILEGVCPEIMEVFEITGFTGILTIR